jgi:hypothetical protein
MKQLLNILGSPRFWAALLALVFIVAKAINPGWPLNEEEVVAAVTALVGFIFAVSATGTPTVWKELFTSFRFWALVASLTFIFVRAFAPSFPISEQQILAIIAILGGTSVSISYRPVNATR